MNIAIKRFGCCLLLALVVAVQLLAFTSITVSGVGLPSMLASPTSDQGRVLSTTVTINSLTLANNTASTQTVNIQDCQSTPFKLFDGSNGSTMAAGDKWFVNGPIKFQGCFKWTASSTSVQGTLTGVQ